MRYVLGTLFAFCCSINALAATESGGGDRVVVNPHLVPDPKYTPREVVEIQIEAMMHNSIPYLDAGIEITFRFASPTNKTQTGPLDRFIKLVNNVAYAPMLDAKSVDYGETKTLDGSAHIPVVVTSKEGGRAGYLFTLSMQSDAPYKGCWMTDAVVRFNLKDENDFGST